MQIFNLTLTQMLVMFMLMLTGYILKKSSILPENVETSVSKILAFVLAPALTLSNQIKMCSLENFIENSTFIFYGMVLAFVAVGLSYPLSALLIRNPNRDPQLSYCRQIYKYSLTFANWGYMGNYIVLGIWGDEALFKYTMLTFFLNVLTYAWGLYIMVPKSENTKSILSNLKTGLLTPPFIALILGIVLGISGLNKFIPPFLTNALSAAGNCMGPMAMLLAGLVIGGYNFLDLLKDKRVYFATLLRLIIIPAVLVMSLKGLNANATITALALIAFATPTGLNTVVYPAAYGRDTKPGASMAMVSHLLSIITIPLMYYVMIILV